MASAVKHKQRSKRSHKANVLGYQNFLRSGYLYQTTRAKKNAK